MTVAAVGPGWGTLAISARPALLLAFSPWRKERKPGCLIQRETPALGSGANYPWPGSYDVPGPFDDLASGQGRGERVIHGQDNSRDYDKTLLRHHDGRWGEDNSPQGPHKQSGKFALGSDTWQRE
jgi:hypothetical protein